MGRGKLEWIEWRVEWLGQEEEEASYSRCTFVPGRGTTRYKCGSHGGAPGPSLPTQYKCSHLYRLQKYPVQMSNLPWDKCLILY